MVKLIIYCKKHLNKRYKIKIIIILRFKDYF
jgi:hypothetical protein